MRISSETETKVRAADGGAGLPTQPQRPEPAHARSTQTIGVISDFVASGAFASQMLTGASAAARSLEHLLVIGEIARRPRQEDLLIEEMLRPPGRRHRLPHPGATLVSVPEQLHAGPTVLLNCLDPDVDLPAVLPDDEAGGRAAAEAPARRRGCARTSGWSATTSPSGRPPAATGCAGLSLALDRGRAYLAGVIPCAGTSQAAREAVHAWLGGGQPGRTPWSASTTGSRWAPTRRWPSRACASRTTSRSSPSTAPTWPSGCGPG